MREVSQQGGERQESSGIVGECGKEERSDTSAVSPLSSPSPLLSFALHRRAVKRWLSFFISRFDCAHTSIVGCYKWISTVHKSHCEETITSPLPSHLSHSVLLSSSPLLPLSLSPFASPMSSDFEIKMDGPSPSSPSSSPPSASPPDMDVLMRTMMEMMAQHTAMVREENNEAQGGHEVSSSTRGQQCA